MKKLVALLLILLAIPAVSHAMSCTRDGYTIFFVNGILGDKDSTLRDVGELQKNLGNQFNSESLVVKSGYNPSHLEGVGDVAETASQIANHTISDYDLTTILLQIYPELTTQKVLLVGHSQGTFYTNTIYSYFLAHGVSPKSVGVYNIATPAATVAGGGTYLTSTNDSLVAFVREGALAAHVDPPLLPNITLSFNKSDTQKTFPGHLFRQAYLSEAPERIVGDISSALGKLVADHSWEGGDCFTEPLHSLTYKIQAVGFAVADPVAHGIQVGGHVAYVAGSEVVHVATNVTSAIVGAIGGAAHTVGSIFTSKTLAPIGQTPDKDFTLTKTLYGSSLTQQDYQELQQGQGGAVSLTLPTLTSLQRQKNSSTHTDGQSSIPDTIKTTSNSLADFTPGGGGVAVPQASALLTVAEEVPMSATTTIDVSNPATSTPTTTETIVDSTPTTTATTTPEVVATSTLTTTPTIFTIASQEDESTLCAPTWNACYATAGYFTKQLGKGDVLQHGSSTIYNFTIAKDETSSYVAQDWSATVTCFTDSDYSHVCPDWIAGNAWNGGLTYLIIEDATTTEDQRHWSGQFTNPVHEQNFDGTEGVRFNPAYYYLLSIVDNGWGIGAYGSATLHEPYWVLRGRGVVE